MRLNYLVMLAGVGFIAMADSENVPGRPETAKTNILEAGAAVLQSNNPLEPMNMYLVGFHPTKNDPSHQMEAHHFCTQMNEDFAQCVLFDSNKRNAKLNGIEYIISEKLFDQLPPTEKRFWHPHNGEILSGQLVAPGIPKVVEHELMKSKMNSYGKTWHTWDTNHAGAEGLLPLGEPELAWSFSRYGEAKPGLVESRDKRMNIDSKELGRSRQSLLPLAKPQEGVDALNGKFSGAVQPIPGVRDKNSASK